MAKKSVGVWADEALWSALDELGEQTGETRSVMAERALRIGVEEMRKAHKLLRKPIVGDLLALLVGNPRLVQGLAKLAGETFEPGEWEDAAEKVKQIRSGKGRGGRGATA